MVEEKAGRDLGSEQSPDTLEELFARNNIKIAENLEERNEAILSSLTKKQRFVIRESFGTKTSKGRTYEDIGVEMGLKSRIVKGIETKGLRKFRHPSHPQV